MAVRRSLFERLTEVAAAEVRSLIKNGYRVTGTLRNKDCECYYLRNLSNGNRASVVVAVDKVILYINGDEKQRYG